MDEQKQHKQLNTYDTFLGYCNKCDTKSGIYERDILPAYKNAPINEVKVKCPNCGYYQLADDLIPF